MVSMAMVLFMGVNFLFYRLAHFLFMSELLAIMILSKNIAYLKTGQAEKLKLFGFILPGIEDGIRVCGNQDVRTSWVVHMYLEYQK